MDFLDLISGGDVLLLDGAMGTELDKRGLPSRIRANLDHPEEVIGVHSDYLDAGYRALITNTLIMNRVYLETHQLDVDVADVNRTGAQLARRAAGVATCILGNLCSTGQLIEPYGTLTEAAAYDAFKEQAGYLADAGVDAFIIETVYDLREALCAVRACREFSPPVIASISFSTEQNGGRTIMGDTAEQCAVQLTDAGVAAVGTNCGDLDPAQMAIVVSHLAANTALPILAEPNAGKPQLVDGQTLFDMEPEPFARGVLACREAGATLIGGCCGSSPAHIRAVADLLDAQ